MFSLWVKSNYSMGLGTLTNEDREIEDFMKMVWEAAPESPDFLPVGRNNYRIYLNLLYRDDDHARLKALYNAGYRGRELRK